MSAEPELDPQQPIGPSLIAIARSMLAQAAHETRAETDALAIHGVRTQMKRWRAYLRLLEPFLDEDGARLRLEARDIARGLAGARDAQSALDALKDLGEEYAPFSDKSLATVKQRIDELRSSAESATLKPGAREGLANAFALTLDAVERWEFNKLTFAHLAESLTDGYRRAQLAIPDDWTTAEIEELHGLRQRVIIHRYQMELVEPLWPRLGRIWIQEAQRLRDRLGRHHDLAGLRGARRPASAAGPLARAAGARYRRAPSRSYRGGDAPGRAPVRREAEGVLPAHDCVVAREWRELICGDKRRDENEIEIEGGHDAYVPEKPAAIGRGRACGRQYDWGSAFV